MMCSKVIDSKHRRRLEEEAHMSTEAAFQGYGKPLGVVNSLKYPGRVLTMSDDDWAVVVANLKKAQRK